MMRRSYKPASLRESWTLPPDDGSRGRWLRAARRFAALLLLLALGALFFYWLLAPFWHPTLHPRFATSGAYDVEQLAAIDYAKEDAERLRERLAPDGEPETRIHVVRTAADFQELEASVTALPGGLRDVPVVYVAAQGIVMDGRAYLLSQDFDARTPERGRYPLDALLERLAQSTAGVKILILDAGRVEYDARLGVVVDGFPAALQDAVTQLGKASRSDPRLWVISSHASLESPLDIHARRQSAFGHFLGEAFRGSVADANGDRLLDLGELFVYLRRQLGEFARTATGGRRTQTPLLLRAGFDEADLRRAPVLRAVGGLDLTTLASGDSSKTKTKSKSGDAKSKSSGSGSATKKQGDGSKVTGAKNADASDATKSGASDDASEGDESNKTDGAADSKNVSEPSDGANDSASGGDASSSEPKSTATKARGGSASEKAGAAGGNDRGTRPYLPPRRKSKELEVPAADAGVDAMLAAAREATAEYERRDPRYEPYPLAVAAPAWRAWRRRLEAYETTLRTAGPDFDRAALAAAVRRDLLELTGSTPEDPTAAPSPFAEGLSALRAPAVLPPGQLPSWALTERAARWNDAAPPAAVAALVERIDRALAGQDDAAVRELTKETWPADANRFVELRFARRLLSVPGLSAELRQSAWETARRGEATAADPCASIAWIRRSIELADAHRLAGERGLRDQLGGDWRDSARARFEAALRRYDDAERALAEVHASRHVLAVLLERVPYYLRWFQLSQGDESVGPAYEDLAQLLMQLERFAALLSDLDAADFATLASQRDLIQLTQARIERLLRPAELSRWLNEAGDADKAWVAGRFLKSGLAPVEFTARLWKLEREGTGERKGRDARQADGPLGAAPPILAADDWRPAARQLALERLLARLATPRANDRRKTGDGGEVDAEEQASRDVLEKLDRLIEAQAPEIVAGAAPGPLRSAAHDLWATFGDVGRVLADVRQGVASRAASTLDRYADLRNAERRGELLRKLREAEQYVRLIDARDVATFGARDLSGRVRRAELYDLLDWHQRRAVAVLSDAPADEYEEGSSWAAQCRRLASDLPLEPPVRDATRVAPLVDGTNEVPLVTRSQQDVSLRLRPPAGYAGSVWLVLAYDPAVFDVESPDVTAYREFELRAAADSRPAGGASGPDAQSSGGAAASESRSEQETPDYPLRASAIGGPASWEIQAGAARNLRLVVKRKGSAGRTARLIARFVGVDFVVRHEVEVKMSALDAITVTPSGFRGSWSRVDSQLLLHPLPNQRTDYRFMLSNQGDTEKTLDVEVVALRRPLISQGVLSLPEAEALDAIGPVESLGRNPRVKLPAGGEAVPFLPAMGEESGPAAATSLRWQRERPVGVRLDGSAESAVNGGADAAQEPKVDADADVEKALGAARGKPAPLAGRRMNHGLLFVFRDPETKQTLFRRVEFRPLQPRAYLNVNVGYDLAQQRIEIVVKPRDRDLIPATGLKIRCETPEPLPPGVESRLEGTVIAPQYEARMFLRAPTDEARLQTIAISAGDYPRAFFYRVPCGVASANLPEADDVLAVRVLAPDPNQWYRAPLETISVKVEVDAPRGSFANGRDRVEIGLDVDRDREFRGELALPFTSDRQSEVATPGFQGPSLAVDTRVGDFEFDLPTGGLQNVRANVLGRVQVGGRSAWSTPVEVVLDGMAPVIRRVQVSAQPAPAAGGEVEVVVSAVDGQMSGVDHVDVALDPRFTGEFGAGATPVPATAGEPTVWTAKLPLADVEPGQTQIVVRAVDRAGNVSRVSKLGLTVLPKEQEKDGKKPPAARGRIEGEVKYADRPIPEADAFLEGDVDPKTRKRKTLAATKADAQGKFVFASVPPGKYVVRVRGLANNRMRLGSQEVQVVSPPDQTPPLLIKTK